MQRRVALIRGINVGRAKRVAMADLRAIVADLGYVDVRTALNSGNVIFSVPQASRGEPALRIEQALTTRLGLSARVIVLTAADMAMIIAGNPLREIATNPSRLLVTVLQHPADFSRLKPLEEQHWTPDALALGTRVAYLWCADGILKSRLAETVSRTLGAGGTSRNWATMVRLNALASEPC